MNTYVYTTHTHTHTQSPGLSLCVDGLHTVYVQETPYSWHANPLLPAVAGFPVHGCRAVGVEAHWIDQPQAGLMVYTRESSSLKAKYSECATQHGCWAVGVRSASGGLVSLYSGLNTQERATQQWLAY